MAYSDHILRVYESVCAEYGLIADENGVDAVTRLNRERAGRAAPYCEDKAEERFLYHDCAFISAERGPENGGTPESNEENTARLRDLLTRLRDRRLIDFFESEGWYQEIGSDKLTNEKGFFCIDTWPDNATNFFSDIFSFAEMFDQDSFLYKSAGKGMTRTGFFIATNAQAVSEHEKGYWPAGELYYGCPPDNYTESPDAFGEKRVFFRRGIFSL